MRILLIRDFPGRLCVVFATYRRLCGWLIARARTPSEDTTCLPVYELALMRCMLALVDRHTRGTSFIVPLVPTKIRKFRRLVVNRIIFVTAKITGVFKTGIMRYYPRVRFYFSLGVWLVQPGELLQRPAWWRLDPFVQSYQVSASRRRTSVPREPLDCAAHGPSHKIA